jgi:acetylornithine deacetylase/succinyl-diaminopimelate desuccinylase-like protein
MLPAFVEEGSPVVRALQGGARRALGRELETFVPPYTFDAGYPCSLGVPTVMCGPSTPEIATDGILGEDAIRVHDVLAAAAVYAGTIAGDRGM